MCATPMNLQEIFCAYILLCALHVKHPIFCTFLLQKHTRTNATLGRAYALQEPNNAGALKVLFKKEMETNQKLLVDIITEALMQELLDYEVSGKFLLDAGVLYLKLFERN